MRIKYRLYLYEPHSRDRLRRLIISCSLQKVRTDLLRRRRRKVDGSHVKDGDRARAALFAHAGDCPGIGCENRARELGVGIKLEAVFNDMGVLFFDAVKCTVVSYSSK